MDGDRYEANGITEHPISITNPLRFKTQTKTQSLVREKSIVFTTNNDKNPLSPSLFAHHNRAAPIAVFGRVWGELRWGVCVSRHKIPVQTKWILVSNQRARTHTESTQHIKPGAHFIAAVCIVVASKSETCHFTLKHTSTHQPNRSQRWRKRSANLIKIYLRYFINIYENFTFS